MKNTQKVTKDSGRLIDNWRVNNKLPAENLTLLEYNWRLEDLPFLGRAMVAAGKTLFVAGPPDVVDETKAFGRFEEAEMRAKFEEQGAAVEGKNGAILWAVSAADGRKLVEYRLDSPPVFDGIAAANGRLYLSTIDGRLSCYK